MEKLKYCLDTHCLVWYFTGQESLPIKVKQILDQIFSGETRCFISAIVLLETFHLSLKKKGFNFPEFLKKLRLVNIIIVPLDKVVLSACYKLPENLEIHDRVIAATAKSTNSILLTKDQVLRGFFPLKTLW